MPGEHGLHLSSTADPLPGPRQVTVTVTALHWHEQFPVPSGPLRGARPDAYTQLSRAITNTPFQCSNGRNAPLRRHSAARQVEQGGFVQILRDSRAGACTHVFNLISQSQSQIQCFLVAASGRGPARGPGCSGFAENPSRTRNGDPARGQVRKLLREATRSPAY